MYRQHGNPQLSAISKNVLKMQQRSSDVVQLPCPRLHLESGRIAGLLTKLSHIVT